MEAADEEDSCGLFTCVCSWHRLRIPHVAPGYDYASLQADADGRRPAWSLLVGFSDGAKLRLHRLRVARSGRILGRSDDALEIFHDLGKLVVSASASLAPDGVSLCVLQQDLETPPQALQLQLGHAGEVDGRITTEELPPLPTDLDVPCCTTSAAGHIWAAYIKFLFESREFSIVMLRLFREDGQSRWEQVGEPLVRPDDYDMYIPWGGRFLQGCTALPLSGGNRTLILVSIKQQALFFTFDCSTFAWTQVDITPGSSPSDYIPILGRGVYIQEDESVYMLRENTIYSYKLHYDEDHRRLKLEVPVKIDSVCPFWSKAGYGFLAHLGSRLMCSIWISVELRCSCKNLHAIVTTFQLPAQGDIKVLHSTCRRIDMLPSMANLNTHQFCFLQEYKDEELSHSPVLQLEEDPISTAPPPLILECCRLNLLPNHCPPSSVVPVKPAIAHIKTDVFIICQAGTQSIVYKINIMDDSGRLERDDGKLLKQFCSIPDYDRDKLKEQTPLQWHFLCGSSDIYAVSGLKDFRHVFGFGNKLPTLDLRYRRTPAGHFVMAIQVGNKTIALTDALEVFKQTRLSSCDKYLWLRYPIYQSHDVPHKKVKLSGYAALGDDSFIVSDTVTNSCLLFDLNVKKWRVVMPYAKLEFCGPHLPSTLQRRCLLNGRSVFVDGFIYTCVDGGLDAYELLEEDDTVFLSSPIFLPLSPDIIWVNETMCLDYAGKDTSGGIIFFVVQGGYPPTYPKHHVRINTVHVNTEKTLGKKMKPVEIGHLDCVTRSVEHEKGVVRLSARDCFAFSSCASDAPSDHQILCPTS